MRMPSSCSPGRMVVFVMLLAAVLCNAATLLAQASQPVEAGYRTFSYGPTASPTPTGEKPENKLWWNDGFWWGSLFSEAANQYHIYRFDPGSQSWTDTGTALDDRRNSKADVLWDQAGGRLYVTSHVFSTNAQPSTAPSQWGRLYRYSYDSGSKTYSLDPGFPVTVSRGATEALTLAKDSFGRLWVTYVESAKVMINRSISNDLDWGQPFVLPRSTQAVSVSSDDISAIVAFQGNKVGVMWSNQLTATTYFAVHWDGDVDTAWQTEETVLPGPSCSGPCSDDLINLKADASGRVFAIVKTSHTTADSPLNLLMVRDPNGTWQGHVFGRFQDHHTRAIVLLDEENRQVYVLATNPENSGAIYFKTSPMDNIQFPVGLGDPFIHSSTDTTINNATSTRQNLSSLTGLLVLASDQNTRFYLHNTLPLRGPSLPTIASFSPTTGPVGTAVTITGSRFIAATRVIFGGTAATSFTAVSDGQIDATVPSGAQTGKIGVTTPEGTGFSATDFRVTFPPVITSFSPTRGPVGTRVTITGSYFTGATRVTFGGTRATSFTVASDSQIDATVPSGAKTGRIRVTTPEGQGSSATYFRVTFPPVITSFTPTSGPVGTTVTITGSRFSGATQVAFGGTPANVFTVFGDTRIVTQVPLGATTGKISVTTPQGTGFSASDFIVVGVATARIVDSLSIALNAGPTSALPVSGLSARVRGAARSLRARWEALGQNYRAAYRTAALG